MEPVIHQLPFFVYVSETFALLSSLAIWCAIHDAGKAHNVLHGLICNSMIVNFCVSALLLIVQLLCWTVPPLSDRIEPWLLNYLPIAGASLIISFHDFTRAVVGWLRYYKASRKAEWDALDVNVFRIRVKAIVWMIFLSFILLVIGMGGVAWYLFQSVPTMVGIKNRPTVTLVSLFWICVGLATWLATVIPFACCNIVSKQPTNQVAPLPAQKKPNEHLSDSLELSVVNNGVAEESKASTKRTLPDLDDIWCHVSLKTAVLTSLHVSLRWTIPLAVYAVHLVKNYVLIARDDDVKERQRAGERVFFLLWKSLEQSLCVLTALCSCKDVLVAFFLRK